MKTFTVITLLWAALGGALYLVQEPVARSRISLFDWRVIATPDLKGINKLHYQEPDIVNL
ncbi:hypothetical protein ACFSUS_00155 [Spirosoma soli]|uniref:Uncharacterized protein n=1 Tax=Spirosoma soli TaxID=1770529 RepID=A0ABW5LY86_9BACT